MANDIVTQLVVRGGQQAATDLRGFKNELSMVENSAVSLKSRGGRGLTEFSRGFEDFAISASTGGIAAGLRGATNNINAYLSTLGGWGAAASVAVTAGTVLVGYFEKTGKATEDATTKLTKYKDKLTEIVDLAQHREELRLFINNPKTDEKDVLTRLEKAKEDVSLNDAAEVSLQKERDWLQIQQKSYQSSIATERPRGLDAQGAADWLVNRSRQQTELALVEDKLAETQQRSTELAQKRRDLTEDITRLEKTADEKAQERADREERENAIKMRNLQQEAALKARNPLMKFSDDAETPIMPGFADDPVSLRTPRRRATPGVPAAGAGSRAAFSAIQAAIREQQQPKVDTTTKAVERGNMLLKDIKQEIRDNAIKPANLR